jgi:hypothetical protein
MEKTLKTNVADRLQKKETPSSNGKSHLSDDNPKISPVDQIYTNLANVFGNSNPRQLFSLVWPGTILNYDSYVEPGHTSKQEVTPWVMINQSNLFDQYYPIATITQPDGTRVSDRYKQAVESYGPKPNETLITLQRVIRDRLDQVVDFVQDGVTIKMTLLEKFSLLQNEWVKKKQEWGKLKSDKWEYFKTSGGTEWWDEYVRWYEQNAEGYIDGINAAYNRMVADFPMNEFEDALAILDTHDAAALLRAKEDCRNGDIPVPAEIGTSFYPTLAIPSDWGMAIKPSTVFTDLLAAPDAQQNYMNLCIEQLRQQIFAWNAVLAQIPPNSSKDIKQALDDFNKASQEYFDASNKLIDTYTDNTVLAVKSYLDYKQGTEEEKVNGSNSMIDKLNLQNGEKDNNVPDYAKFKEIADKIGDAQKKLNADTGSMVSSGQRVGQAATAFLNTKAGEGLRQMIEPILEKLQSQIDILVTQIGNFSASASRAIQLNGDGIKPLKGYEENQDPLFVSEADTYLNQRWAQMTIQVKTAAMSTSSSTNTSFEQSNWGVDFFFGSAGGESTKASEEFASEYLSANSDIQIGFLATKVLIERPWMHPEIFNFTSSFFKAVDSQITTPSTPFTSDQLMDVNLGGSVNREAAGYNCNALNQGVFPCYPVAVLLAKDITIKIKLDANKTSAIQSHSEQNESNGGGFLCFSVSKTQSSSADSKSASSYSMGGDFVFRIPAPQIIGVWNQILPPDKSEFLNSDDLIRILQFKSDKSKIESALKLQPYTEEKPARE